MPPALYPTRHDSAMLRSIDAIVLGRAAYQLFVESGSSATGPDAERLNGRPRIGFSRTFGGGQWNNPRLAGNAVVEEITRLKQQPGRAAPASSPEGLFDPLRRTCRAASVSPL